MPFSISILLAGIISLPQIAAIAVNISFTSQPGDLEVKEGHSFSLSCNVSLEGDGENFTVQYHWRNDGQLYTNGPNLHVESANISHNGIYVCVVTISDSTGNEVEKRSRNATVTVLTSDTDSVPQIAMIVSVSAVSFIIIVFFITIGLYMCLWSPARQKRCGRNTGRGGKHHRMPIPGRLSPSAPRHLSKGARSKSKSLSHLLQSDFPMSTTLHKSSTDLLAGSQPTQTTEIEDHNTLDYDLGLDEDMFEQELSSDKTTLLTRARSLQSKTKRTVPGAGEAKRRASEGTLVVTNSNFLKPILKESKSFNDNLHNHRRGSAISDDSSDITQSDENSLQLEKSVRFNVSGEDWAQDSGVHTGSSTPHNTGSLSLNRRASEPDTSAYHFPNSERRGSAPGDLVSNTVSSEVQGENDAENEGEGDNSGEIDDGLVTGSEEWTQQQEEFSFDQTRAERRFENVFLQPRREDPDKPQSLTQQRDTAEPKTSGIASRVAQFISASQRQTEGSFIRGPSPLATTSHTAGTVVSKVKVAEMKEKFLRKKGQVAEESGTTVQSEGRRPSVSKLVQERAEVFKDKHSTETGVGLGMGSLKRAHHKKKVEEISEKVTPPRELSKAEKDLELVPLQTNGKPPDTCTIPVVSSQTHSASRPTSDKTTERKPKGPTTTTGQISGKSTTENHPVTIPVFSAPSGLSNWVPACLRDTVISPTHSYTTDGDNEMDTSHDSDDSDGEEDVILEALEPTVGRALIGAGASFASFGGVASMSPIGRSWLSSVQPSGLQIMPLGNKPGPKGISPFNESFSLQQGQPGRSGGMQRLSVIPEETASACNSMVDIHN